MKVKCMPFFNNTPDSSGALELIVSHTHPSISLIATDAPLDTDEAAVRFLLQVTTHRPPPHTQAQTETYLTVNALILVTKPYIEF